MRYLPLGRSGLLVSAVGLGCNNFGVRAGPEESRAVIDAAVEEGVTLFDTADIYGGLGRAEEILGAALAGRRDQVVIATKFGHSGYDMGYGPAAGAKGGRSYVRRAVEASLRRLRTDWIDLYQLHTPDPVTPVGETLAALHELVQEGKVRYLGHSNLSGWQIADAAHVAAAGHLTPFVSAQNEYSLLDTEVEAEVVPACTHFGVGLLPFYPLASGLLTGKVSRASGIPAESRLAARADYVTDVRLDRVEALAVWAAEAGRSLLEVAIGGLAAKPAVASVIAGAMSPAQVRANAAAGAWVPTPDERDSLDALTRWGRT